MKLSEMSNIKNKKIKEQQVNMENIEKEYEQLKNHSSSELMELLAKEVENQKEKGLFDYEGLLASVEKMKEYLPQTTYQNMIEVIKNLR